MKRFPEDTEFESGSLKNSRFRSSPDAPRRPTLSLSRSSSDLKWWRQPVQWKRHRRTNSAIHDTRVSELTTMGYTQEMATHYLERSRGDVALAVEWLERDGHHGAGSRALPADPGHDGWLEIWRAEEARKSLSIYNAQRMYGVETEMGSGSVGRAVPLGPRLSHAHHHGDHDAQRARSDPILTPATMLRSRIDSQISSSRGHHRWESNMSAMSRSSGGTSAASSANAGTDSDDWTPIDFTAPPKPTRNFGTPF